MARGGNGQGKATLLGLMSTGLGTAQVIAPAAVNRLVGVRDTSGSNAVMRAVGLQEVAMGGGILARRDNTDLLWARVAGDLMHLSMLAAAARERKNDTRRISATAGAVAGVTLLDLLAARRPTAARNGRLYARSAITINRSPAEVYGFWRDLENLPRFMHHLKSVQSIDSRRSHWVARAPARRQVEWDAEITEDRPEEEISWRSVRKADIPNAGTVHFAPAPGGAGTEVTVEIGYVVPAGRIGAAVATMLGEEPTQQIKDDLRRFKQVLETGEVVRSDGTPEGTLTHRQLRQLAAQPRD